MKKLKKTYGRGIDVIVVNAIYLRANVIKAVLEEGYQGKFRLKERTNSALNYLR